MVTSFFFYQLLTYTIIVSTDDKKGTKHYISATTCWASKPSSFSKRSPIDMRLTSIWRTKLVVFFTVLAAVWNTFVVFNYQYARQSLEKCPKDIKEQSKTLVFDKTESRSYLKGLQKEIDETFRRFEAKNHTVGKAFRLASLHGKRSEEREQDIEMKTSLPDCKQTPYLLILVHSAPANFMEREAIRLSWGRSQNSINDANAGKQLIPWFVQYLCLDFIFQVTFAYSSVKLHLLSSKC